MMILVVMVITVMLLAAASGLFAYDRAASRRDLSWLANQTNPDPDQAAVYLAYLNRHNQGRLVGGLAGILIGVVAALRWDDAWTLSIGVGTPLPGNLLVWWMAGVVVGTLAAETYRLPRRTTTRQALLEARPPNELPLVTWVARGAALAAVALAGLLWVTRHDASGMPSALFAVVVVALAEATQRAISNRPRPVGEPAVRVDGRLRWYASSSVAWLEAAGAGLALATAIGSWAARGFASTPLVAGLTVAQLILTIGTITAIVRSRMRAPRGWVAPDHLDGVVA